MKHDQCVELRAEHLYHTETSSKWICQSNLDDFWAGHCLTMQPHIELCDEDAINVFLGKCVQSDGFKVCPSEPVVVEHLKTETEDRHVPKGCYMEHGKMMCPSDLSHAF